jgi:hypothetical protein
MELASAGSEQAGYRGLNRLGRGARTARVADRATDNDMIGAIKKRLFYAYDALLVAVGLVVDRPDAGRDDQQS